MRRRRRLRYEIRVLFYLALIFAVCGCALRSASVSPRYKAVSYPPIGESVTRGIGEELVVQGKVAAMEKGIEVLAGTGRVLRGLYVPGRYYIIEEYSGDTAAHGAPLDTGTVILKGKIYALSPAHSFEGGINFESAATPALFYNDRTGKLCAGYMSDRLQCVEEIPRSAYRLIDNVRVTGRENYQKTLLYTGKEGDVVKFTYREFMNDMARPAFTVDVSYDLKDGDVIGFKTARLKIIEATNSSITYSVLKNFD